MANVRTKATMEEFTTEDQENYYSGITSITVNGKRAYELKGKFLNDLCDNAFSGTNGDDAVEHIEYFLEIFDPINLPNVNHEILRLATFLISLYGNKSKWFDEIKGIWDPNNTTFKEWLASKFSNHAMMDPFTKKVIWDFWKKSDDQNGVIDDGFSNLEEANNDDEQEIGEIFRIETNLFNYETPLCTKFNEFNYLLKVDPELFTYDIERNKTYEDYKNELNDELEKETSQCGPSCHSDDEWFCDGGELPGMVRVGYMTYFQDHEWYDGLMDESLKNEALEKKAIYEKSWGDASQSWKVNDHECSPFANWRDHIRGPYATFYATHDPYLDINQIFDRNGNSSCNSDVQEEEEHETD
ncbi:hypothetical protein Tco_0554342 [Tanacetum coccineum]